MLSDDNYVDIHALKRPGMTITEIDRRTDNDRKAIRSYLARERFPGVPQRADPDSFEMFVTPVTARLTELNRPGFRSYCFPCVAVANTGSRSA